MIRLPISLLLATVFFLLPAGGLFAQSQGAADANNAAFEIFASGDYAASSAAYEKLIKDYPTDAVIPFAQVQLAFSLYLQGNYDQALAAIAKISSGPPLAPELKQTVDSLVPQILLSKAAALPPTDSKRMATFNEAIKKFSDFITAYPQAKDLENAIYGKALAEYQIEKFDDTVKDLEANLQRFPQSSTIATSKNLLAIALAVQGSQELNKRGDADTAKAFALYQRAIQYLKEIIDKKEDIALINEANFQLGEILFNQAAFSPEAERAAIYQQAFNAYRNVAPKDQIVTWQQEKIKQFPELRRAAALKKDANLIKQLNTDNERELKKLAEMQGKPDQVATALMKIGEIYFQQQKINEARVVLQHVAQFLQAEEDAKRALYFTTMTYAVQNAAEKATSGYESFQGKYKGDALADNLPFTLGNMYLSQGNVPEAIKYFNESLEEYPQGRFLQESIVSKALAESQSKQYDSAMKTFQDALAKNPTPQVGALAQFGIAGIYKDTGKWDEAIAAYKTVQEKYPNTPQANESEFWIAHSTMQKGDNAGAIPLLDAFFKAHTESPYAPLALYLRGVAQLALGQTDAAQKEAGFATLTEVAEKYPQSQPAPFTYLMRANLRAQEGKSDDAVTLLKQFVEKYPQDPQVFNAYQNIAATAITAGKVEDALSAYRDYVTKYPESQQVGDALVQLADLQSAQAEKLGRYGALNEEERTKWKALMDGSVASAEELIEKYPDNPAVITVFQVLLKDQKLLASAELKKPEDIQPYFQAIADKSNSATVKGNALFTLAGYLAETDKAAGYAIMAQAYDPAVVYSGDSLDAYGLSLIEEKKYPEATAVIEKLAKDYPLPAGVPANQISGPVLKAQAAILFGRARLAQEQGQTAEAGKLFEQLKALYPWSSKVLEANYGIALAFYKQGQFLEGQALLNAILRAPNSTPELNAKATLLLAEISFARMNAETDPAKKDELLKSSIDTYLKIAQSYGGFPLIAAEGLWKGSQLLEQQAAATTDPKFKTQQLNRAKSFYQQLVKDYPNSEYASKAQERITALGTP